VSGNEPLVRIGMIQSTDGVEFSVDSPFSVTNLLGDSITNGQADRKYKIGLGHTNPASLRFRVRLAIADDKTSAENAQKSLSKKHPNLSLWQQGITVQLNNAMLDNREYWLVTEPFESLASAKAFQNNYEPLGQAAVVKEVVQRATGELIFEDHPIADGLCIIPSHEKAQISLDNVEVGIEFHWQHQHTQKLEGILEVALNNQGRLVAINELGIEDYVASVNSSEMTPDCPVELLRAQTVAARSTILATMGKHHYDETYHVCSDDHCQCYHGIANVTDTSRQTAEDTRGQNLVYNGRICDARYSKICGGVMEGYPYIWDNRNIPYLVPDIDGTESIDYPLDTENKVKEYVDSSPDVYCNTAKYDIPENLPYNSKDLFRWQVNYSRKQLQDLIHRRTGEAFGDLIDLVPIERGPSGRLIYLDVIGSKRIIRIGKELAIRRALSESHLYSSCFYIRRERDDTGAVDRFSFIGAGWGHGVGLCQVGATVMAQLGFNYEQILKHYYKGAELEKLY
jgi:stage II sporulation protein D